ncbi:MAG: AMP-binding protein [Hyphomicrobiaceae bacterium]
MSQDATRTLARGYADSPMRAAARRFADRLALADAGRTWTFAAFDILVDRLAGGLAARLAEGERVALYMRNSPEYLLLSTAIERAGLVRVPLNVRYTALEVRNLIADCGAAAVCHDLRTLPALGEALAGIASAPWHFSVDSEDACGGPTYGELAAAAPIDVDRSSADLSALSSINYTSGTSGRPKGVMLTRANWRAVTRNMMLDRRISGDDRLGHIGPLTHASGTYFQPFFLRGAASVVVTEGTVEALLGAIDRFGITGFTCVPSLLTRVVNHPAIDSHDLSSLAWIGYGAEPIPRNTLERSLARFGPVLTQNYGLTEAMMTCAFLPPADHFTGDGELRTGSIGRAYSFVDIVLRDGEGRPVPVGEIGEITIRAEHVMAGYWRMPEETAKVLREGWLWSGDLARMDAEGFITLAGRSKDMIISGGFNIYPQEVEACLTGCPGVREAAVVGIPDEAFGELCVAFLVADGADAPDPEVLVAWAKPRLGIKTPRHWRFVADLPKNSNGKLDKPAIRRMSAEIDWR